MMIKSAESNDTTGGIRLQTLRRSAYRLRQSAINTGDLEGWRLARRMRDATLLPQAQEVERELTIYLRSHTIGPLAA